MKKPLNKPLKKPLNKLLKKVLAPSCQIESTEEGLTLVECLAAVVIFSLTIVAITPPIMLAMASRVRSYRAQQAMKLAQSEVDRVRLIMEAEAPADVDNWINQLPADAGDDDPQTVAAPGVTDPQIDCWADTDNPVAAANQTCLVDLDRDNDDSDPNNDLDDDFAIQTYRTVSFCHNNKSNDPVPVAFMLGVRVYTRAALKNNSQLSEEAGSLALSAVSTASASPLTTLYTKVVKSDLEKSAIAYQALSQKSDVGAVTACP